MLFDWPFQSTAITDQLLDSTVAGLNCESTLVENATATLSIITEIDSITTAINSAANQTALIGSGLGSPLLIRQATTGNVTAAALAGLTEEVLLDLNGALSGVLSALGLSMNDLPLDHVQLLTVVRPSPWLSQPSPQISLHALAQSRTCRRQPSGSC